MRYLSLASDYDGTLARDGVVDAETVRALERLRHSGRKLILVTGRELPDLQSVFSRLDLFERVVAENGALLYDPATHEKRTLAQKPPDDFIESLRKRGVSNMSVGEVIVATWHPHEQEVLNAIREFGLELQVIFNKDAVMILPSGVNKMTGLSAALEELKLSRHNVVGVGDAENDHAFLSCCEFGVAVANAIPALKERADFVTERDHGAGVIELVEKLLKNDLADLDSKLAHYGISLGSANGEEIMLNPRGNCLLICGESGGGKSTFVAGFLERLIQKDYQTCLVDPEGDYQDLPGWVGTGDETHAPSFDRVVQLLDNPDAQVMVNLVGVPMTDRAGFFASLLTLIQDRRLRQGRPHWLIVDEAHHMLPSEWAPAQPELAGELGNALLVTVHPEHVSAATLKMVKMILVVGRDPHRAIEEFARITGTALPEIPSEHLRPGEAILWLRDSNRLIPKIKTEPPRVARNRHKRKYAEGELEKERVFYFRGPEDKLNLRAQNLATFLQIADGIDDETWLFHLKRADYSNWLRSAVKDTPLAEEIHAVEQEKRFSAVESRQRIKKLIEEKYTAPA